MMKIIYKPENMLRICEYAGRTCWQSHEMQKKPTSEFISALVNIGHESVIEHAQIILKLPKKEYSAGSVLRAINNTEDNDNATETRANLIETDSNWYMGINMRGLKNIIRNTNDNNVIVKHLKSDIIPQLPHAFFSDFIKSGVIDEYENKFGVDLPYFKINRKDKFFYLTDLVMLESDIKKLLLDESELTPAQIGKMITMSVRFVAPRWLCTQLIRHRSPVSQESLRYVNAKKFGYHTPKSFEGKKLKIARHILDMNCPQSNQDILEFTYDDLMDFLSIAYQQCTTIHKIKQEDARNILPLAIDSEIIFTRTMSQWSHVDNLRLEQHTQLDTRVLMTWFYLAIKDGGFPLLTAILGDKSDIIKWEDLYNLDRNY